MAKTLPIKALFRTDLKSRKPSAPEAWARFIAPRICLSNDLSPITGKSIRPISVVLNWQAGLEP